MLVAFETEAMDVLFYKGIVNLDSIHDLFITKDNSIVWIYGDYENGPSDYDILMKYTIATGTVEIVWEPYTDSFSGSQAKEIARTS